MKIKRSLYILLICILSFQKIIAQDVTVTSAFDTSRIYLGDHVGFNITVDQPSGLILSVPVLKDTLCKNIEILNGPQIDSLVTGAGRLRVVNRYLVTSFDSGFYNVPPVYAEIQNRDGIKRFYSDYNPIEVMRVNIAPADTTAKIYDIIKPYSAPLTLGEILPWILMALLAGALIWILVKLIKKLTRSKDKPPEVINPDPAHIIAFRELEKLKEKQLWQKGEVKQYYSSLTEIIRQYLENRYRVFSLELTTSETLDALVKTGFKKNETFTKLKTILTGSDLVKFAKYKPESAENELHFRNAWEFIEITMEKAEAAEQKPEQGKEEKKS